MTLAHEPIGRAVGEYYCGLEGLGLLCVHPGVGHDDDDIARLYKTCCRSIEADDARATLATDDVGLQACAIVVVDDLHLLACDQVGSLEELLINGDAPYIVKVGFGDGDSVYVGLE